MASDKTTSGAVIESEHFILVPGGGLEITRSDSQRIAHTRRPWPHRRVFAGLQGRSDDPALVVEREPLCFSTGRRQPGARRPYQRRPPGLAWADWRSLFHRNLASFRFADRQPL